MSDAVADVLDDAADLLERDGWCQGRAYEASTGSWCASGAIGMVSAHGQSVPAHCALADAVAQGTSITTIFAWNDADGRTVEEVLDALRAAAKAERMAGSNT